MDWRAGNAADPGATHCQSTRRLAKRAAAAEARAMAKRPTPFGLRIRLVLGPEVMIGPGKADLLEGIRETGSIAAAGRGMGMSYKRAWMLVEAMNAGYRAPLVETSRGGRAFGGATLTALGAHILDAYRRIEAAAAAATQSEVALIRNAVRDIPRRK